MPTIEDDSPPSNTARSGDHAAGAETTKAAVRQPTKGARGDEWWLRKELPYFVACVALLVAAVALINTGTTYRRDDGKSVSLATFNISVPGIIIALFPVVGAAITALYLNARTARRAHEAQERADRALANVRDPGDLLGFVRANASQMHAYDLLARRQAAQSHRASLGAMFVGLALVSVGVAVAVFGPDSVSKIAGAGVTAVGAAAGGYIAKTFLTNSRRAAQTAAFYFRQPLVASYLLTAERLAASLPEAEQSRARLAVIEGAIAASMAAQHSALAPATSLEPRTDTRPNPADPDPK